jgi:hypothetical protein
VHLLVRHTIDEDARYKCKQKKLLFITPARYRVILSVLDRRKCEYLKDYSRDFEHAYMITYLAS